MNVRFSLLTLEISRPDRSETVKGEDAKPEIPSARKVVKGDLAKHAPGLIVKLVKWIIP